MISLDVFALVLTGLGLIASIIYYANVLANTNKTRQAQILLQIYNRLDTDVSKAYYTILSWEWKDFDDFMNKYGEIKNPEVWTANGSKIANFFMGIGVLVKHNMIEPELIDDFFGNIIIRIWEKMAPVIFEYRVRYSSDKWLPVEHLYKVVKPLRDKRFETGQYF